MQVRFFFQNIFVIEVQWATHEMAMSESPGKMYALAAVLSVLAILAVILRFYSRRLLKTVKIDIDDYMILLALVCHTFSSPRSLTSRG